jgi:hypothetical protein
VDAISPDKQSFLIQMVSLQGLDGIFADRTLDLISTVTISNNGTREADLTVSAEPLAFCQVFLQF